MSKLIDDVLLDAMLQEILAGELSVVTPGKPLPSTPQSFNASEKCDELVFRGVLKGKRINSARMILEQVQSAFQSKRFKENWEDALDALD